MRGDTDQVADVRNRKASISLPINPLKTAKINNTRFGRIGNAWGKGQIGLRPGIHNSIHLRIVLQ